MFQRAMTSGGGGSAGEFVDTLLYYNDTVEYPLTSGVFMFETVPLYAAGHFAIENGTVVGSGSGYINISYSNGTLTLTSLSSARNVQLYGCYIE